MVDLVRHRNRFNMNVAALLAIALAALGGLPTLDSASTARAADDAFVKTHSRAQYVHWITLYDAGGNQIDPQATNPPPYSPAKTCGKCHDYKSIAHGYHFNAFDPTPPTSRSGRPGEPWIWTDIKTGTQLPLSARGWAGTYKPGAVGINQWDFVLKFARHLPGGGPGVPPEPAPPPPEGKAPEGKSPEAPAPDAPKTQDATPAAPAADAGGAAKAEGGEQAKPQAAVAPNVAAAIPAPLVAESVRWKLSGQLDVECLLCHSNDRSYSSEVFAEQVGAQNFAWAATAAAGLAKIDGRVDRLKDDFDPAAEAAAGSATLPKVTYYPQRFNAEGKVFFDVIRKPTNNSCYVCHTARPLGDHADWNHDDDVHVKAGLSCVDCHRNDLGHHTVRAFEGEEHPTDAKVSTLSCRGCHLGSDEATSAGIGEAGRLGAPKPAHKGLPPLHLEKMSCTSCHSGPAPQDVAQAAQTSLAHGLDVPGHYDDNLPPGIVQPVLIKRKVKTLDGGEDEVIYPYRQVWPAFWGVMDKAGHVTPLNPDEASTKLRTTLRVRDAFTVDIVEKVRLKSEEKEQLLGKERADVKASEYTAAERAAVARFVVGKGLAKLAEDAGENRTPVYISGGKAYRIKNKETGEVESFENDAAKPYQWALGHDVRPARWSLGVTGCFECHSDGAAIFEGKVSAIGPLPDAEPVTTVMYEHAGFEPDVLKAWNQSFQGRSTFKWIGFISIGIVALVLLLYLLLGMNALVGGARRARK